MITARRNAPSLAGLALGLVRLSGDTPGEIKDVRYSSLELRCAPTQNCSCRVSLLPISFLLAGLVTNDKLNVVRADFDCLKAVLTNCIRYGLETQNRERRPDFRSHLQGRVSFVEMINRQKGRKLRILLERIPLES